MNAFLSNHCLPGWEGTYELKISRLIHSSIERLLSTLQPLCSPGKNLADPLLWHSAEESTCDDISSRGRSQECQRHIDSSPQKFCALFLYAIAIWAKDHHVSWGIALCRPQRRLILSDWCLGTIAELRYAYQQIDGRLSWSMDSPTDGNRSDCAELWLLPLMVNKIKPHRSKCQDV
jgi:hypothetical protein